MEKFEQFEEFGEEEQQIDPPEQIFHSYVEKLRITPEDLKKNILDVGAGGAGFAKWAKEQGIADKIYSLEPREEVLTKRDKSIAALAENIPFRDESFDLVISVFAIPNIYLDEGSADEIKEKVKNSFNEMVRVLKPGGEIRLASVLMGEKHESRRILSQSVNEELNILEERDDIQVERIRTPSDDPYEYDENNNPIELLAETYLIIIRKIKTIK